MKLKKKMVDKIILASKSKVRKKILEKNGISCLVKPSNVDEDLVKESLLKKEITPGIISRNLITGKIEKFSAHAVVLATGGYGNVFYCSSKFEL